VLADEFPEIFNLCLAQTLENAAMDQEMKHPMTEAEENRYRTVTPKETLSEERIWKKRPDGLAIKMPTPETAGEFVILEFKRMSDVTDQYITRARNVAVAQYASIKSALERTLGPDKSTRGQKTFMSWNECFLCPRVDLSSLDPQGWSVSQRSFIAGARCLNEQDLHDNLAYFKVPQAGIELDQR
jgi:hypothetical protein